MKKIPVVVMVIVFIALAAVPWLICNFQPRSLLPDEMQQERINYDATVELSRNQTQEAQRQSTSMVSVSKIGTAVVSATAMPLPESTATPSQSTVTILKITSSGADTGKSSPTPLLPTVLGTPVSGAPTLAIPTIAIPTVGSPTIVVEATLATPFGMIDRVDEITEAVLIGQLKKDATGSNITDITVNISATGVQINSNITVIPGIIQKTVAKGTFSVNNNSLVIIISSIKYGDVDVTDQYARNLESRLNTSLYRLLPQRYVQSFTSSPGKVKVLSKVRP